MKIRDGFVSNSSSSSFILFKTYLTQDQIDHLKDYENYALSDEYKAKVDAYKGIDKPEHEKDIILNLMADVDDIHKEYLIERLAAADNYSMEDYSYFPEGWLIEETENVIDASTTMDNYDLKFFCKMIGINIDKCGLMLEEDHAFTVGNNDAKTDLKNYVNDDMYWENYDKYWYESKYYREKIYPIKKKMFDEGNLPSVVDPDGLIEWVRDKDNNINKIERKY